MRILNHELTHIFKSLDKHKGMRMNHSHFTQFIRQLTASLDKASIEVDVELHRLFIISLSKLLQFWTKVAAIRIWRIRHCRIERRGKDVKEGHGIVD